MIKRDTILIFEDSAIDREILVEIFRMDYKILEASNGKEGIALLNSHFASIANNPAKWRYTNTARNPRHPK